MSTTTDLSTLKINYLTQAQYQEALDNNQINENELYCTPANLLVDMFYPIGSYYETSDTTFNPNITWGGTWVLETEGQVHVSAGTNYTVSGALTNRNDGGATSRTVPTTKLTAAQSGVPAHGHGHSLTLPDHKHHLDNDRYVPGRASSGWVLSKVTAGSTTTNKYVNIGDATSSIYNVYQTDYPNSNPSITGSVSQNTASDATTVHGHGSIDVRQPYIVVNRWHRTA